MPARRILLFDGNHLSAALSQGGALLDEGRFTSDEAGLANFRAYLETCRRSHFYLLANVPEEGFQLETLPYTQGADRKALFARKLNQYFYGTPFSTALPLGREKSGRRDERVLFSGLTRPASIETWLNILRAENAQLVGIYTPPLIAPQLLQRTGVSAQRCVLITFGPEGIRQTFLEEGQVRFSRLTPLSDGTPEDRARACAAESMKLYQYLAGQRMLGRGPLPTLLLVHPADAGAFVEICRNTEELRFQILDLQDAAHKIGLKSRPADSSSQPLYMHLLAARPPAEQFAPSAARRYYRLWQARTAMLATGSALLLACLLFSGKQLLDARSLHDENERLQAQSMVDSERYAAILKGLPPLPVSVENLRSLIDRYQQLERRSPGLEEMYAAISRSMDEYPKIELDRIEWTTGDRTEDPAAAGAPVQAASRGQPAAAQVVRDEAVLYGHLPVAMLGDQRAMLGTINGFADALREKSGLDVSVTRMPFDIESGKSIKGGSEEQGRTEPPRFVIRVSRRHP